MTHQNLAEKLCTLTNEWLKETNKTPIFKKNNDFFKRQFFSRLYYSLYHKILNQSAELASKSGPGIHKAIEISLSRSGNDRLYQHFMKLLSLRVWADYKLDDNSDELNLIYEQNKTYRFIKQDFNI